MMTFLLAVVLPVLILAAWALERRERATERRELVAAHERERKQWMDERTLLLNRIKPETAQPVLVDGPVSAPAAIPFDDDDAFWENKDELAERAMRQELEAR